MTTVTLQPPVRERPAQEIPAEEDAAKPTDGNRGHQDRPHRDFGSRIELALSASNHLFNSRNAPRYVAQVLQGDNAVATKLQRTTRPFTGVGPGEMAPY